MRKDPFTLTGRRCFACGSGEPRFLLIQPEGEREQSPEKQPELIASLIAERFLHLSFITEDWNRELSPWSAPAVFGSEAFGKGAPATLAFIEEQLLPYAASEYGLGEDIPVILGGYSLAAFFSLWCVWQTEAFAAAAAASPSVWFPGWLEYAASHRPKAGYVYLSLGDREEKAKNRTLATVGDCIRAQYRLLEEQGVKSTLEWNHGNHFMEPELRCAKGFAWCMEALR